MSEEQASRAHEFVDGLKEKASELKEKAEDLVGGNSDETEDSEDAAAGKVSEDPTPVELNLPKTDVPQPLGGPGMPAAS